MATPDSRKIGWLRSELPALVAAGVISAENASAIERHYEGSARSSRNLGFVLLAALGSALVAAGIILLIAHNWDELSRPVRSVLAFLPLVAAQLFVAFVLLRRDQSQAWREGAAIFNVAAIGTAISLVSQTYQITGSLPSFILVWMLLSIPIIYLLRTTLGAMTYVIGATVWLFVHEKWGRNMNPTLFWLLLLLVVPYFVALYRRERTSRETGGLAVLLALATAIGLGFTADYAHTNLGALAFAGLFSTAYICGIEFFPRDSSERLHPLALLGGVAIGVMTIVLTFAEMWRNHPFTWPTETGRALALAIELGFPLAALALAAWSFVRQSVHFSVLAAGFPIVAGLGWIVSTLCPADDSARCKTAAAILLDLFALGLGVELIARGLRARSTARANFGLLVISALAIARFFDSDITFVGRAVGFIVIGLGFIFANLILFKRRTAA